MSQTYSAHSINNGGRTLGLLAIVESGLLAHQCPQFVQVDGGAMGYVPLQVVVSHTHLTKVSGMAVQTHGKDRRSDTYNKGLKKNHSFEINVPQLKT